MNKFKFGDKVNCRPLFLGRLKIRGGKNGIFWFYGKHQHKNKCWVMFADNSYEKLKTNEIKSGWSLESK